MDENFAVAVLLCIVAWGLVSRRMTRWNISGPMVFVALGLVLANEPLAVIDVGIRGESVKVVAELTLAILLFSDASRVNLAALRVDAALPLRLLLLGLPLTIGFGLLLGMAFLGGASIWIAGLIAAAVAPTDAALGAPVVDDTRVPVRVRRVLNVESGLNDGIATPFVFAFLAGALSGQAFADGGLGNGLGDLGIGVVVGVVLGVGVALVLGVATRRGWSAVSTQPMAALALSLVCYLVAVLLDANGFVAAFVGGMAFGGAMSFSKGVSVGAPVGGDEDLLRFSDEAGGFLSLVVWFVFGAAMIVPAFEHIRVGDVIFAVLALTVVRMVPVALALMGSGLDRATVAFIGWFGPRGLASVVFALIAVDELSAADAERVLPAIGCTVVLSIVAHGVSASPLAVRYARHAASIDEENPEHHPTPGLRTRSRGFQ